MMIKMLNPYYEEPQPLSYKGTRIRIQLMTITDLWGFFSKFNYEAHGMFSGSEDIPWIKLSAFVIGNPNSFKVCNRARRKVTNKWNRLIKELSK